AVVQLVAAGRAALHPRAERPGDAPGSERQRGRGRAVAVLHGERQRDERLGPEEGAGIDTAQPDRCAHPAPQPEGTRRQYGREGRMKDAPIADCTRGPAACENTCPMTTYSEVSSRPLARPSTNRPAISTVIVGAQPHTTMPAVNTAIPATSTPRGPWLSLYRP